MTNFSLAFLAADFFVGGDVAVLDHLRQHAVARLFGAVEMALGRGIAVGRANDSREKRRLARADLADVLAEIGLRGFAEAANRKAAAIAEINIVGVELENLLLGEALVELGGHQDFLELCGSIRAWW